MSQVIQNLIPKVQHPDRFAKALQNPVVRDFISDGKRFKVCHAGRRGFKTYLSKRFIIAEAMRNDNHHYFVASPTHKQARMIWWEDLKQMSPKWFVADINESMPYIEYRNGSTIWCTGLDVPSRIEGKSRWDGCIIDEYGDLSASDIDVFATHIRPLLADTGGFCWLIGVSRSIHNPFYKKISDYAKYSKDSEWADYTWASSEFLPEEEIASIKAFTDEKTYLQEYCGLFQQSSGLVYSYWSRDVHMKTIPINLNFPLFISADFNISPCIWVIGQIIRDNVIVLDEIVGTDTDVWKMCNLAKQTLVKYVGAERAKSHEIEFVGDYTSAKRRDVSAVESSWDIIREEFTNYNVHFAYESNPRIIDRVNGVNGRLRSADGKIHLSVPEHCKYLINDFETINWDLLNKDKATGDLTHASDALGYAINTLIINKVFITQN